MKDVLARLNGTTKLLIQTGIIVTAVGGFFAAVDGRYAKADDVKAIQAAQSAMEKQQQTTNSVLLIQYQTRKTILELKQAAEGLTPAEQVELKGINKILKKLEG